MMTELDRANVKYLLSLDNEGYDRWWNSVSEEDHIYALHILKLTSSELMIHGMELSEAKKDIDLTEANEVIERIRYAV